MNSRERVLTAMAHKTPDRAPVDFGSHRSSGISAIAYAKLKKTLGITSGDIYVYDMVQQLAIIEPEVLDYLEIDLIELGRGFLFNEEDWKPWILPDGTPCKIPSYINIEKRNNDWFLLSDKGVDLGILKEGCLYFEQIYWPWLDKDITTQNFSDLENAFANSMWIKVVSPGGHIPLTEDGLKKLKNGARLLRESTDRAILGIFGGNLFEVPQFLYRMDNYLMYMGLYPEDCIRLSETLCDFYMPRLEKWLKAVGPYIDIILFGDDLGGQNGPLLSPEMYRNYYKPYHKKMWKMVKELAPHVKIQLHCCGGVEPLLEDLIDAGLDMINPVQITCAGMDAKHLKDSFGDRMVFCGGGCDTRKILPLGTEEEIKKHVRNQVDLLNQNGGFIFQQVHNILADVPVENIIAMFDAVRN
ncbi:MAG: methyltransferase [bacterium]|nr:methyltransferase [bacterium]